ncbi:MAG: iron chelate uptake ABC transporter family permease subunit, partial [Desulfobulbaceae bacterium]|nr:iron chelate uptake ABC transporter family permease subunit [Desulfobulbaceae bacterium]
MFEFITDLTQFRFLQYALLTGVMASVACGIVGSYVTVRRITYIAGAIAHCTLGGMGAARYLQKEQGILWLTPLTGAVAAALLAALIISYLQNRSTMRQDTILSAVWSIGMAIGLLFISKTSGYNEDLMSYLFGDILMVSPSDLALICLLDIVLLVAVALFYNRLLAISFDEEFARLSGIPVARYNTIFLCLVALTVVLLVQVVGIILVVALLTLPAATAGRLTSRLPAMMLVSVIFCLVSTTGGLMISYNP